MHSRPCAKYCFFAVTIARVVCSDLFNENFFLENIIWAKKGIISLYQNLKNRKFHLKNHERLIFNKATPIKVHKSFSWHHQNEPSMVIASFTRASIKTRYMISLRDCVGEIYYLLLRFCQWDKLNLCVRSWFKMKKPSES